MKLRHLLLYIGFAIITFWAISLALKLAGWVLHLILVVGVAFVIASLIATYAKTSKR